MTECLDNASQNNKGSDWDEAEDGFYTGVDVRIWATFVYKIWYCELAPILKLKNRTKNRVANDIKVFIENDVGEVKISVETMEMPIRVKKRAMKRIIIFRPLPASKERVIGWPPTVIGGRSSTRCCSACPPPHFDDALLLLLNMEL
ncbi:hypothetical protein L1987_54930 [Smallanthus sonchifolius]|uniref:Uncharacterized protein n=1 Tax=Smallanthus sonchifolius TaxID=185202 RepID=A0ACB9E8Y8_9ASTR|nr:hypothetical protein L1987_54930 [Smallanthus sonchifolius]